MMGEFFIFCNGLCILFALTHKTQAVQLAHMLGSCRKQVDSGGIDAAVPQNVSQPHDIPTGLIKGFGKQMAEIMGKYLGVLYPGGSAQLFQLCPDLPS